MTGRQKRPVGAHQLNAELSVTATVTPTQFGTAPTHSAKEITNSLSPWYFLYDILNFILNLLIEFLI